MQTLSGFGTLFALAGLALTAACQEQATDERAGTPMADTLELSPERVIGNPLAPDFDPALRAIGRSAEDRARDAARKPREVLEFAGIGAGMTVLDYVAGGGWYTEVLSAAVGPGGKVIAHNTPRTHSRAGEAMQAKADRLRNVDLLVSGVDDLGLDQSVDAALTALNLHDFYNRDAAAGIEFLRAAFDALKPGGVFVVIDHEGSAGQDNRALHRLPLSTAVAALEQAGFIVEEISDILDNPADDHTLHMRDESLGRDTDRFLIRARKPG